jgi:hypothetical protein
MKTRIEYLNLIKEQVGKPYLWGAWGSNAFDCSGLVSYCLGLEIKHNAQQLFTMFERTIISKAAAFPGALYFYGSDGGRVSHVMTVLEHWSNGGITLIGARGGDSSVITLDIARDKKAFVDVCFGDYWWDKFLFAVDPF